MRIKQRARTPRSSDGTCTPSTALPETARLALENTRISTENTHLRQQVTRLSAENTRLTAESEQLVQCRAAEKESRRVWQKRGEPAEQDEDVAKELRVWELHVEGWVEENEELKRKVARIEEELVCLRTAVRVGTVVGDGDGHQAAPGLLGADREGAGTGAEAQVADTSPPGPQLYHQLLLQCTPTKYTSVGESISQGNPEVYSKVHLEPITAREDQADTELATMREQLERVRAELERVTAENKVLEAAKKAVRKESAGYKWLNCENASLSKYMAELEGKLKRQTSEARAAKESLSQMAIRLLAAMNGHDAADVEKKDLQSRNMELASELERTRKDLASELATAKMDIKFKGCEIANLKSRNTQRSQLLRAVQDELEMRRLNDEELMEENERILSLLARANEASEANEANKVNGESETNEENEDNESNEENGGNDAEEVNHEVNGVNGVNGVNEEQEPNEKNEGNEKKAGNEKNEGNEGNEGNEEDEEINENKELALEKMMGEVSDIALLGTCCGRQREWELVLS